MRIEIIQHFLNIIITIGINMGTLFPWIISLIAISGFYGIRIAINYIKKR